MREKWNKTSLNKGFVPQCILLPEAPLLGTEKRRNEAGGVSRPSPDSLLRYSPLLQGEDVQDSLWMASVLAGWSPGTGSVTLSDTVSAFEQPFLLVWSKEAVMLYTKVLIVWHQIVQEDVEGLKC